jgi:large subunit ribosomal protein L1
MARKHGKLYRAQRETFDRVKLYSLDEAAKILKAMPHHKFDESVEVAVRLGIDTRQSDQTVRGAISLPHGSGKKVRVVVIAADEAAKAAHDAGADHVGYEELLEKIKGGWLDFDVMIATPAVMGKVRGLGRVLGPRGLMPNPKTGTVTDDTATAVREAKGGRVEYRADKGGCAHVVVGKLSFAPEALAGNIQAVMQALSRSRPAGAKGAYLLTCTLSSTMSPGIKLEPRQFVKVQS